VVDAVIDVGSNSVILMVAEVSSGNLRPILETTAVTALGEGTKSTGILGETGISSTLCALREAFSAAKSKGARDVLAFATMAARIAGNAEDFLSRAALQGTPVRILSADREAELGFAAVSEDPLFAGSKTVSVIDVGGHSTELATGKQGLRSWQIAFRRSFPVGTLGLRELGDFRLPGQILRASRLIDETLGLEYMVAAAGEAVSLGATGVNLASIRNGLNWQPSAWHGARLEYEEVARAAGWLCGMSDVERAALPGIEPGREKTVHLGALILERFMYAIRVESCTVSDRGWRHAMLMENSQKNSRLVRN
jgi:exopolyphosphatase/guanosine-5'-triphosphate,3'-diphosphate pyrophosphatase